MNTPMIVGRARPRSIFLAVGTGALGVASRHPSWAVTGTVASLVAALAIAIPFSSATYESTGTLLYAPLTGPDTQGSLYVPPDLKTLVTLAKAPGSLEAIRKEFKLKSSIELLDKSFKVTVPSGTKTVEISLRWDQAKRTADMVNGLMEEFRRQVADVRKVKINGYVDDFEEHVEGCRTRLQAANTALSEFNRRERVGDINADLARLNGEVQDLDTERSKAVRELANYRAQLEALEKHIADLKDKDRQREDDDKKADAAEETVADNRRRQDRLRELIAEERMKMEIGAKLIAARAEATRIARLAERGHASRDDLDSARAQITILEAQIKETDNIQNWKDELARIDKVIVPKGKTKNQGSTAIEQIVFKKLELTLFLTAAQRSIDGIKGDIIHRDGEIRRLMGLQQQQRSLARVVESCDAERLAASAELTALKKLQAIRTFEFAIVTPASPGLYPASSNRKFLFLGILGAGLALTLGGLTLADRFLWPRLHSAEEVVRLGLPIFGMLPPMSACNPISDRDQPAIRQLAMRLRQATPEAGSMVMFSGLGAGAGADAGPVALNWLLAQCLARRDERILILDLAGEPEDAIALSALRAEWSKPLDAAGLRGYLEFEREDPGEVIFPTLATGVDCLTAGASLPGADLLATHRMRELITTLRARYTMILAIGPRAEHGIDLEMLSGFAAGLIFHAVEGSPIGAVDPSTIRHLCELDAPILGAILSSADAPEETTSGRVRHLQMGGRHRRALP